MWAAELAEQVTAAFKSSEGPASPGILVNIFGGIMDCNVIARGVVTAARETDLAPPLWSCGWRATMFGGLGKQTLAASELPIISAGIHG